MSKTFKGGLDSLIGGAKAQPKKSTKAEVAAPKKRGRPTTVTKVPKDTTEEGTLPGEKRATFIVKEEQLEKLKAIAYWDRVKIKNVMDAALEKHIAAWEKKHGPVKQPKG
jgi:hypothetical protein